jgi:hypothetical protein
MTPIATVLYEDKADQGANVFPLHDLVVAMVADRTGMDAREVGLKVEGIPRAGASNVLRDLRQPRRRRGGGKRFILVDRDQIHRLVDRNRREDDDAMRAAICELPPEAEEVGVHFLYQNMEDLLRAIEACEPARKAPERKKRGPRDLVLAKVAWSPSTAVRDCLMKAQRGLAELVDALADLCRAAA